MDPFAGPARPEQPLDHVGHGTGGHQDDVGRHRASAIEAEPPVQAPSA
ncbi:hypothetical protein ACFVTM_17890 [Arthrobacter sp. NPDC058130]